MITYLREPGAWFAVADVMSDRNAHFLFLWLQDNIISWGPQEWDENYVVSLARMCVAEARYRGVTLKELERAANCELEMLIMGTLEAVQNRNVEWNGLSGMPSRARH